jgi:hypothetical protein
MMGFSKFVYRQVDSRTDLSRAERVTTWIMQVFLNIKNNIYCVIYGTILSTLPTQPTNS